MKDEKGYIRKVEAVLLTVLMLVAGGCASTDDVQMPVNEEDVPTVKAKFLFSFSGHIAAKKKAQAKTRMPGDIVQETGYYDDFRGYDDVHMLCFNSYPTASSKKIGKMIEMKANDPSAKEDVTEEDYSEFREISIPVGTSHFGFYARAADSPLTHEEKMKYGVIETVGLDKASYTGNSGVRFRPVQICPTDAPLGGSERGQRLLTLLNNLMNITGPEAAPNDKWATVNNMYLNEAYQRMKQLKVVSSQHVAVMLAAVNRIIHQEGPDAQGTALADAITAKIAEACDYMPPLTADTLPLKADYLGFPDDLHLPTGAARIAWDDAQGRFVVPDVQAYGKALDIPSTGDYCYPMNLQYQVLSNILASDKQYVLRNAEEGGSDSQGGDGGQGSDGGQGDALAESWNKLVDSLYVGSTDRVQQSTQSVAMVQQVNYAVGRLALHTRLSTDNIYDASGKVVDVSAGFTLKGYIVGGQREVDYNFQPVEGSREYAIYDNGLNGEPQHVERHYFTDYTHILGLGTAADKNIYLALELENDGPDFQGADGIILHGTTFYLVAELAPAEGTNHSTGSLDQIFCRDRATKVNLTIKSLAPATYGLPDLDIPHPTVGVSVNLVWEEGLWYPEVPL